MVISPSDIFGLNRARAAAKSIKFNPRNLEFLWYPFWTRAISRIACEIDSERCMVAPQYPLWRIWTHDDTQLGSIIMLAEGDAMDDLVTEPAVLDQCDSCDYWRLSHFFLSFLNYRHREEGGSLSSPLLFHFDATRRIEK